MAYESLVDMTVVRLRELAEARDVDLTGLTLKDDIIDALVEAGVEHGPELVPDEDDEVEPTVVTELSGQVNVQVGAVEGKPLTGAPPDIGDLDDPVVVEYGAEQEPKTGGEAVDVVREAEASQVAASEAQDEALEKNPPRKVAATRQTNIQTPTGMVQRVDELAEETPAEGGYTTRPVEG